MRPWEARVSALVEGLLDGAEDWEQSRSVRDGQLAAGQRAAHSRADGARTRKRASRDERAAARGLSQYPDGSWPPSTSASRPWTTYSRPCARARPASPRCPARRHPPIWAHVRAEAPVETARTGRTPARCQLAEQEGAVAATILRFSSLSAFSTNPFPIAIRLAGAWYYSQDDPLIRPIRISGTGLAPEILDHLRLSQHYTRGRLPRSQLDYSRSLPFAHMPYIISMP